MIHPSDEVLIGGMILGHDRRAVGPAVVHHDVDAVAQESRAVGARRPRLLSGLRRAAEIVHVLYDVHPHAVQVLHDARHRGVLVLQLVDEMLDGEQRHLPIERLHPGAQLAPPAHHGAYQRLELVLQGFDGRAQPLLFGVGQPLVVFRAYHLAVLHRREGEACRRAQQPHALGRRFLAECVERFLVPLGELSFDLRGARPVLVALEQRRYRVLQLLHELLHVVAQPRSVPRRQRHRDRPVRLGEVVEVDPVGRDARGRRARGEECVHERALAAPRRPHHEEVVAVALHVHGEPYRVGRASLREQRRQCVGARGPGREQCWIAVMVELLGGERAPRWHDAVVGHVNTLPIVASRPPPAAARRSCNRSSARGPRPTRR